MDTDRPATSLPAGWLSGALLAVLIVHVPAFVCMPPHYDVIQWDLDARTLFNGQVLYRDVLENNFPGMLPWQALVRAVAGWSSESIRVADLLLVGACIWLLTRQLPLGASPTARVGTALVLSSFYLTTNEWCHAQRDTWMLLPVLLALILRQTPRAVLSGQLAWSFLEGLLWGVAVWIKPYAFVPALACYLASLWHGRRAAADTGGLLLGGLAAGAAGLTWLATSGAWTDFWDVVFVWNREYVAFDMTEGNVLLAWAGFAIRFFPWLLLHLIALPLALVRLWRPAGRSPDLFAVLYLGWLVQALLLQHRFDYTQVPSLFLAITLLCREGIRLSRGGSTSLLIPLLLASCVLFRLVPATVNRLPLLVDCLRNGSTPELRDRLSLLHREDWQALAEVEQYLRKEGVKDGEVGCLNMGCASLYLTLDLLPSTRYVVYQNCLVVFSRQRGRILAELAASNQRYLLVDVEWAPWKGGQAPPAGDRVRFSCGRYRVYAITGPEMAEWVASHLDLPAGDQVGDSRAWSPRSPE